MLTPQTFKETFGDPAIRQFADDPSSLIKAATLIWSLDALASHVALASAEVDLQSDKTARQRCEEKFKRSVRERTWQFFIVNEASNALKHGWRRSASLGAETSELLFVKDVSRHFLYWNGPSRAPRWGPQVVIRLGLAIGEDGGLLRGDGKVFPGPFNNWVPLLGLVAGVMEALGFDPSETMEIIGQDWPS